MPATHQEEHRAEGNQPGGQQLSALIGDQVLLALGHPGDLHRIQVCKLWDDRYRVNVFTGLDASTAVVADSFFLIADAEGKILDATPNITRRY